MRPNPIDLGLVLGLSGLSLGLTPVASASRNLPSVIPIGLVCGSLVFLASVTSLGLVLGLSDLGLWHNTMLRVTNEIPQRGGLLIQYTECEM